MDVTLETLDLSFGRLRAIPSESVERMSESLRRRGQLAPVVVSGNGETPWILVDGFARRLAARALGWSELRAESVSVSGAELRAQMYLRNRERGFLFIEECRLVHDLCRGEGLAQVEAAVLLERHKSWVCRRLAVYDGLAPALREGGLLEACTGGSLARLALLPARNQEELHAVWLAQELSTGERQALIAAYHRALVPEARRFVLEHPRQALALARQDAEARVDPRLGEASQVVADALAALEHLAVKHMRKLRSGVERLGPDGTAAIEAALRRAEGRCGELFGAVRTWLAGPSPEATLPVDARCTGTRAGFPRATRSSVEAVR